MKKLKPKQSGPWCQFCEPKTARATHVGKGFTVFCCEDHKHDLKKIELENEDDLHMTEADYQSWYKL